MITKENLLFSTFIGLPVEITNSSQRGFVGLSGNVVDETKNLIVIEVETSDVDGDRETKEVKIPKVSSVFRFTTEDGKTTDVAGADICFRPHERPKKV